MFDEEDIALFGTPLECNDKVADTITAKRYLHFVFDIRAVADTRWGQGEHILCGLFSRQQKQ